MAKKKKTPAEGLQELEAELQERHERWNYINMCTDLANDEKKLAGLINRFFKEEDYALYLEVMTELDNQGWT